MSTQPNAPPEEDVQMEELSFKSSSPKVRSREEVGVAKSSRLESPIVVTPTKKLKTSPTNASSGHQSQNAPPSRMDVNYASNKGRGMKRQTSLSEHFNQQRTTSPPKTSRVHQQKGVYRAQGTNKEGDLTRRVAFLPEPYPLTDEEKKKSIDRVRTNDVRYSLAFQLSADFDNKSSALHRRALAAQTIVQIVDAAGRLLREDLILRPWKDCMLSSFPAEKISIASEWEDPTYIRQFTSNEIFVGRGGWVNTKVRIGSESTPTEVEKYLHLAASTTGAFSGRALVEPIQSEDVENVGWFYMSSEAVELKRLEKFLTRGLDGKKISCSFRNIYITQRRVFNPTTGENDPVYPQVKAIHIDCVAQEAQDIKLKLKEWFDGEPTDFTKKYFLPPMKFVVPYISLREAKYKEPEWLMLRSRQKDFHEATSLVCTDAIKNLDAPLKDKEGKERTLRQFIMKLRNNDAKTKGCHPHLFTHIDMTPTNDGTLFQYPTGLGEYPRAVVERLLAYLRYVDKKIKWDPLFSRRHREEADLVPWDPKQKKNYVRKESELELLLSGPKSEGTKGLEKDINDEMEALSDRRSRLQVETLMAGYHIPSQSDTNSLNSKTIAHVEEDDKTIASMTTVGTTDTAKSLSRTAVEAMMSLNLLTEEQKAQLQAQGVDMSHFELKLPDDDDEDHIMDEDSQKDAFSALSDQTDGQFETSSEDSEEQNENNSHIETTNAAGRHPNLDQKGSAESPIDSGNYIDITSENVESEVYDEGHQHECQDSEGPNITNERDVNHHEDDSQVANEFTSYLLQNPVTSSRKTPAMTNLADTDSPTVDEDMIEGANHNQVSSRDVMPSDVVQFVDGDIVLTANEKARRGISLGVEATENDDSSSGGKNKKEISSFSNFRGNDHSHHSEEEWDDETPDSSNTSNHSSSDSSADDYPQKASNQKIDKKYPGKSAKRNSTARGKG